VLINRFTMLPTILGLFEAGGFPGFSPLIEVRRFAELDHRLDSRLQLVANSVGSAPVVESNTLLVASKR